MTPPEGISPRTWRRISRAKQRLLLEGVLVSGVEGIKTAVITIASELRIQDITEEVALMICRTMPYTTNSTPRHAIERRQIPRFVAYAYAKEQPLLSGCPRNSSSPT
jgi:hypothetical protein